MHLNPQILSGGFGPLLGPSEISLQMYFLCSTRTRNLIHGLSMYVTQSELNSPLSAQYGTEPKEARLPSSENQYESLLGQQISLICAHVYFK